MITYVLQHEGGRAAYEDAQKQISEIHENIETKTSGAKDVQHRTGKLKQQASESRKTELVSFCNTGFAFMFYWNALV